MGDSYLVPLILLSIWLVWGARKSMWRNAHAGVDAELRAAAVARLTQKGRAMFAGGRAPPFEEFVDAMGGDCSAAGMSTPAAYYGFRAMTSVDGAAGITAERVALLASPV